MAGLSQSAWRGQLMDRMPEGAILSVALPAQECGPLAGPDVDLAAVNGPGFVPGFCRYHDADREQITGTAD